MLKVRKYAWQDQVCACPEWGFGDTWAATSYLLRISEELRIPVRVRSTNMGFKHRVNSIVQNLNTPGKIRFVEQSSQRGISYCEMFSARFVPTKKVWRKSNSNVIAYQFDGFHLGHQKNLPHGAIQHFLHSVDSLGYYAVDVGHKKPIDYIINVLANCKFFVGCPSGLSVVCMSVGTPIHLITRNLELSFLHFLENCQYKTTHVQMNRTVKDFLSFIEGKKSLML